MNKYTLVNFRNDEEFPFEAENIVEARKIFNLEIIKRDWDKDDCVLWSDAE